MDHKYVNYLTDGKTDQKKESRAKNRMLTQPGSKTGMDLRISFTEPHFLCFRSFMFAKKPLKKVWHILMKIIMFCAIV